MILEFKNSPVAWFYTSTDNSKTDTTQSLKCYRSQQPKGSTNINVHQFPLILSENVDEQQYLTDS